MVTRRSPKSIASPFRYPGGKGFLTAFLAAQLEKRFPAKSAGFAEPYCGGAGAALNLLADDEVDVVYLNDADIRIFSAWKAITQENDRFLERIKEIEVNIKTWETCVRLL